MLIWKRPKKATKNTLFYLGLLSLLGSILWLSIFYIWNNRPDLVKQYDQNMPNVYTNKIDRLMTRTHKGKSPGNTFYRLQQLAHALKGITQLHKFYKAFTENQIRMIDYLISSSRVDDARTLANKWQKDYPYDFNAKFKYAEILADIDIDLAFEYYQNLYKKHKDIFEVNQRYVTLLLKQGLFNQALEIAEHSKSQNRKQNEVKFYFYYVDELHPKYEEKSKIFVPAIETFNQTHQILLTLKPHGLRKLRFDIDRLLIGSTITSLSFNIATPTKRFPNIAYKPLHHLTEVNGNFNIDGMDPYVQVLLPEALIGSNQELHIEANIGIVKNKPLVLDAITRHKDWKFNCSANHEFLQGYEQSFSLVQQRKGYSSKPIVYEGGCQYIKIQFPLQQNFTFSQLKIKATNVEWTEDHIVLLNGIEKNEDDSYVVLGENPFVVLNTNQAVIIDGLKIQMELGNKQGTKLVIKP